MNSQKRHTSGFTMIEMAVSIAIFSIMILSIVGLLANTQSAYNRMYRRVFGEVVSDAEIAERTIRVLKDCVPSAVPGIAFLSGGQDDVEATARLDAMNRIGGFPWHLTFSYGRALQHAPQVAWSGKTENVPAAQAAFSHRAEMNGLATLGEWSADIEKKAA